MPKKKYLMMIAGVVGVLALGGLAFLTTHHSPLTTHRGAVRATYYCPMHPTYTSDRPGDCPICNMTLVKREENVSTQHTAHRTQQVQKTSNDICYLHQCPMVHAGQPCPMLVVAKKGERVTCPVCGVHIVEHPVVPATKKLLYWTDPMIPGYKSDKPGKSPMGMDMVPVYEEETTSAVGTESPEGYASIQLSPQKRQLIGVTTALVERRVVAKTIRAAGRIAYDPQLYQAEQEYLQALSALLTAYASPNAEVIEQAQRLIGASRSRLRLMGVSEESLTGMTSWAGPDQRLLGTDPSGEVWLYAPIYEFELPLVRVGQTVLVELPMMQGPRIEGTIRTIDPILDAATRSAKIRAVLQNPGGALKPEMYVNALIQVDLGEVVAVPEAAVFATGTRSLVFVDKGEGLFEPREVTLGAKADDWYEIKSGAQEGERIVTSGNFLIDSESRLKAALQGSTMDSHQHGQ